jgi:hypothetical protein
MDLVRTNPKLTGLERIRLERQRQVNDERMTDVRDDAYTRGELRRAAACYELAAINDNMDETVPRGWPLPSEWWKPRGILRNLEKAGALYQADLDRIQRKFHSSSSQIILFLEDRIKLIGDEIDKFLAPMPGDPNLTNPESNFAQINQLNLDQHEAMRFIESAVEVKRKAIPLYYEEHLRRKLAMEPDSNKPNPSGSILNSQEICMCGTGVLCEHRLEWLISYLKRANVNLNIRTFEAQATIDTLLIQIEDLNARVAELTGGEFQEEQE